jgi:cytochrome P450
MRGLRARVVAWLGRRYLAKAGTDGLDLSKLPEKLLWPLRRDGLDPVPVIAEIRETEPIKHLDAPFGFGAWLVTGHAEVREVLSMHDAFSNDFGNLIGSAGITEGNPGGLGFADPPDHTRLRKMLTPEFTMRKLRRLQPRISEIVESLLDDMAAESGPVDLVQMFALPVPSLAICELLGVPYEDRAEIQRLSTARFDLFGGATAAVGAISESLDYLKHIVEKERRNPGDGLLGGLVKEHGDTITDDELAGLADGLLTGGLETTASMVALGALVLLRDPACMKAAAGTDDEVNRLVEELLRALAVVQVAFPRFAKKDLDIGGVHIEKGDVVVASLSAANRDPRVGDNMELIDPTRPVSPHVAFGYGIHRCVGAELGRMELRIAYPALVKRFPELKLAVEPSELSFRQLSIVYGVDSLPVLLK